jgi:hypothetical protein
MLRTIRLLGIFFTVLIIGCNSSFVSHSPDPYARTLKYPVYVDKSFTEDQKGQIRESLEIWNKTFNGYQEFYVRDSEWVPNRIQEGNIEVILNQREGLRIVRVSPSEQSDGILGWVDDLGDETVHLIPERCEMYGEDKGLKIVSMHEIGHALGIPHNGAKGSLLYPYYTHQLPANDNCIDNITAMQLSRANERFELEHLNFCNLP